MDTNNIIQCASNDSATATWLAGIALMLTIFGWIVSHLLQKKLGQRATKNQIHNEAVKELEQTLEQVRLTLVGSCSEGDLDFQKQQELIALTSKSSRLCRQLTESSNGYNKNYGVPLKDVRQLATLDSNLSQTSMRLTISKFRRAQEQLLHYFPKQF